MYSRHLKLLHVLLFSAVLFVVARTESASAADETGTLLYNGIILPETWPPDDRALTREPMAVPYLEQPPSTIPIDTGRQFFVDDFLIEENNLRRVYHRPEYLPGNPVLKPDKPWELLSAKEDHPAPTAMPFSDGVWFDPKDNLFKLWYMGGYVLSTCYAVSRDGISWEKPELDVVPGTNIVQQITRDSNVIWLDHNEKDPDRRFKMFVYALEDRGKLSIYFSPDGIHWTDSGVRSGPVGDRTTVFYNPFREVWVYGIRAYAPESIGRYRRYWEHPNVLEGARWEKEEPPFWVGADALDPQREDLKTPCELYSLDAVAYESLLIGLFDIWRGQPQDRAKPNELCVGFSRDGFHWTRPSHDAFLPVSETIGDWNWANVQSAGGCCLVVGDQLYFYVSAREGVPGSTLSGVCSMGLATLRRDGFVSMEADTEPGVLVTRPVIFSGIYLFVNVAASGGELRVEILDKEGKTIMPYTEAASIPIGANSTRARVSWEAAEDLAGLTGRPVRFKFHLRNGALYSFWVSPSESGSSNGYVAAGGPGFTGPKDMVGSAGGY